MSARYVSMTQLKDHIGCKDNRTAKKTLLRAGIVPRRESKEYKIDIEKVDEYFRNKAEANKEDINLKVAKIMAGV